MFAARFQIFSRPVLRSAAKAFNNAPIGGPPNPSLTSARLQRTFFTNLHARPRTRDGGAEVAWRTAYQRASRRAYRRQAFSYQRFNQTQGLFRSWASRPTFYYEVGGIAVLCGGFYAFNLESVPVSGRKRFNVVSSDLELRMSRQMYEETIQQYRNQILPPNTKEHRLVQQVLNRLVPHSGMEDADWEIHVINDDQKNAFVIPGGKVFVFRGILDVCQGEDGLAAVLGHEIAHNVARHSAERMSQAFVLLPIAIVSSLLVGLDVGIGRLLVNLAFTLPGSRAQEQEADYIGLLMMAESCYDPTAAVGLWSRMEKEEQSAPPQFLSTHPSSHNRLEKIRNWLPEAEQKREDSDCAAIGPYLRNFQNATNYGQRQYAFA